MRPLASHIHIQATYQAFIALVNEPVAFLKNSAALLVQFGQSNELSIINRFVHITVRLESLNEKRKSVTIRKKHALWIKIPQERETADLLYLTSRIQTGKWDPKKVTSVDLALGQHYLLTSSNAMKLSGFNGCRKVRLGSFFMCCMHGQHMLLLWMIMKIKQIHKYPLQSSAITSKRQAITIDN